MLASALGRYSRQSAVGHDALRFLLNPRRSPARPEIASWVLPGIAACVSSVTKAHECLIKSYVRKVDTNGLIQLDAHGSAEIYSSAFKKGRSITKLTPEEHRRAMLVAHLVYEKGYKPSDIVLEHSVGSRRLDVLVKRPCGADYMYGECKRLIERDQVDAILERQIYPLVAQLSTGAEPLEQQRFGLIFSSRLASDGSVQPDEHRCGATRAAALWSHLLLQARL
jgi:hypothetical protein